MPASSASTEDRAVNVVFRVDASRRIGAGHLARCLSLADALKARGARCRFLCRHLPDSFAAMIASNGHGLARLGARGGSESDVGDAEREAGLEVTQEEDARQTTAACAGSRIDWLVVDHYALDAVWERAIRASATQIIAIDDLANRPHDCDVLLDQNLYSDADTRYRDHVPQQCRLLLGPAYALLRKEFRQERVHAKTRSGPVRRILVCYGGVDAANHTAVAIEALRRLELPEVHVDVVIGAEHPRRDEIAVICKTMRFTLHVQTTSMAKLMAAADLAIAAGGSATWEFCCLGLPVIALAVAHNQTRLVHDCALAGVLYALGQPLDPDCLARHLRSLIENPLLRQSISQNGMRIVDGRGTDRVLRALGVVPVEVRPAVVDDARNLFEWRNHPSIRQVSRSNAALEWSAHNRWLGAILTDPGRVLLIGETAGRPVGVVRFDVSEDAVQVSIYIVPGHEHRGTGADLLAAAEMWVSKHRPGVRHLNAEVLGENVPSHRLFAAAGYQCRSTLYAKRI
jgi:UDP-2,4-diacetamido-2,4,6-trideoxy-beta-L-altropyranose hydrolase